MTKLKHSDPIVIAGFSLRLPGGVADEPTFWSALTKGEDLVTSIPSDRWSTNELSHPRRKEPGKSISFAAGVLSRIDEFDAGFFGISPREAAWIDPQQRLLLELAWEAMENGGQKPSELAGKDCAVYVGIASLDYGVHGNDDLPSLTSHFMTGNTFSIAANRISYAFDLRGPSVAVDTACSSSLVAFHQACNSLDAGDASMALVGGVNLLLHPYPFVGFTKASMLSDYGQCRAFDASGAGYVRAEGGAVFVLKRMSQAIADGNTIHAVVLASGINSDGARKSGMTIPSAAGQEELMRAVLAKSGIQAADVDYLEAHGTGTAVGDPIEAAAIGAVYGRAPLREVPLPIGSVKTNLGHLEAASGMAGLAKAVLALKNRAIPESLHFKTPNPNIDFTGLNIEVANSYREIKKPASEPMVVGLNSFGFGGANAHVLLQEAPLHKLPAPQLPIKAPPLFISARSMDGLRDLSTLYAKLIQHQTPEQFYDTAYSAIKARDFLPHRLAVIANTPSEVAASLGLFAAGEDAAHCIREDALMEAGSLAFVYSGNGSQWQGMGQRLLTESPQFASHLEEVDAVMQKELGFSVKDALFSSDAQLLSDAAIAQPLLFAMQVCITQYLREAGVGPAAVAGHSVGEVAAAWASGSLTLIQAVRVIGARSAAQALTRGSGIMAAVGLSQKAMQAILLESGSHAEIAGINSPSNVTISGSVSDLELVRERATNLGAFYQQLDLDYAFHSAHMDCIEGAIRSDLRDLLPSASGAIPFVSTVTGNQLHSSQLTADYWWENIRQPVLFESAIRSLTRLGCRIFVEIGPHAILQRYISECVKAEQAQARILPSLTRSDAGQNQLDNVVLKTALLGSTLKIASFFANPGRVVSLPNYPWQRERYWHPESAEGLRLMHRRRVHPLLGWRLKDAEFAWENTLDVDTLPWLADHKVGENVVYPGSAYVEMALAAGREWLNQDQLALEEIDILAPIVFEPMQSKQLHFVLNPRDGRFEIRVRARLTEAAWTTHALGRIMQASNQQARVTDFDSSVSFSKAMTGDAHYGLTRSLGLHYGPEFQGIESVKLSRDAFIAQINGVLQTSGSDYILPPAVLDCCFQALVDFFESEIHAGIGLAYLPVKLKRLTVHSDKPIVQVCGQLRRRNRRSLLADFELFDANGNLVAIAHGCRFQAAGALAISAKQPAQWRSKPYLLAHPRSIGEAQFATNATLMQLVREGILKGNPQNEARWPEEGYPLSEALSLAYIYFAFKTQYAANPNHLDRCIQEATSPYLCWMIECLQQEGLLVAQDGSWYLKDDAALSQPDAIWKTLQQGYPAMLPQLTAMGRIGMALSEVVADPLQLTALAARIQKSTTHDAVLDESPFYASSASIVSTVLQSLVEGWSAQRPLRILELSAGQSGLARHALSTLPGDRLQYTLAVPSLLDADQMRAQFRLHSNLQITELDLAHWRLSDAVAQAGVYDVLIVRHAIHRTQVPSQAIVALRHWLAPQGMLILAEHNPSWALNLQAGTDATFWHSASGVIDEIQSQDQAGEYQPPKLHYQSALKNPQAWMDALIAQQFGDLTCFDNPIMSDHTQGDYVVLARAPSAVQVEANIDASLNLKQHSRLQLLADSGSFGLAGEVMMALLAIGHSVQVSKAKEYVPNPAITQLICMLGWDEVPGNSDQTLNAVLELSQSLLAQHNPPQLTLVCRGGALLSSSQSTQTISPIGSALWGMGRVIQNECPQLQCRLIDLPDTNLDKVLIQQLVNELAWPDPSSEIILTSSGRFSPRLQVIDTKASPSELEQAPRDNKELRYQLDFLVPGRLRNLRWVPQDARPLESNEIEVKTSAVGLNFRDVMYSMGLLRDEAVENGFAGTSLGLEFSGVVSRIGSGVKHIQLGQRMMGFAPACFASHVITKASAVTSIPGDWSFEAAATVPTTFFTACYALVHLARLQAGERVLIHGAAGGVGIAAIQLAQHVGADIIATAGTDEKRDFVRLLGVERVLDSRSLDFADQIHGLTGGEGVDVILNSLSGEAIRRNLQVLKPFGRFLELGKRDYFENTSIGLRPFKDNISYFGIDADQLLNGRPDLAAAIFADVMHYFEQGIFTPLPYRAFSADRVVEAFRVMQQSRQIGKIVVTMDQQPRIELTQSSYVPLTLAKDSTWLVTGGLAGFGLASAHWLVQKGVTHLILLGRRGLDTPGSEAALSALTANGVQVEVVACDITDRAALASVFAFAKTALPPIKGILHAAAHFDDGLISGLDQTRMSHVLNPKMTGAWNLHELSRDLSLGYFVLYSSFTTAIGNPGQANYVAANAGLEGLARMRQAQGLPVTCIAWGPIADAGYLERNPEVRSSLAERLGDQPLTAEAALKQLEVLLIRKQPMTIVADFDWAKLSRLLPSASADRFAFLNAEIAKNGIAVTEFDLRTLIHGKTPEEAEVIIAGLVQNEVAQMFSMNPERIDRNRALHDLGMDSLMAVELATSLEQRLGMRLTAALLNEAPTVNGLSQHITRMALGHGETDTPTTDLSETTKLAQSLAKQHGETLSAEDLKSYIQPETKAEAPPSRMAGKP